MYLLYVIICIELYIRCLHESFSYRQCNQLLYIERLISLNCIFAVQN